MIHLDVVRIVDDSLLIFRHVIVKYLIDCLMLLMQVRRLSLLLLCLSSPPTLACSLLSSLRYCRLCSDCAK